ncbi:MAG: hypothetical protein HOE75_14380 [Chloroflexi bacterium]|nr:hypothetical protein [Chloroflexota bacterium]
MSGSKQHSHVIWSVIALLYLPSAMLFLEWAYGISGNYWPPFIVFGVVLVLNVVFLYLTARNGLFADQYSYVPAVGSSIIWIVIGSVVMWDDITWIADNDPAVFEMIALFGTAFALGNALMFIWLPTPYLSVQYWSSNSALQRARKDYKAVLPVLLLLLIAVFIASFFEIIQFDASNRESGITFKQALGAPISGVSWALAFVRVQEHSVRIRRRQNELEVGSNSNPTPAS